MPKFICSGCNKILIRNNADMRITKRKSYCESAGKHVILTRLKIRTGSSNVERLVEAQRDACSSHAQSTI